MARAIYGVHSETGKNGAVRSSLTPADTGSPGKAGIHFTTPPVSFWILQLQLPRHRHGPRSVGSGHLRHGLPSFLTLTPGAAGSATLANNRPLTLQDAGNHLVELTATGSGTSTMQEFVLTILNPLPSSHSQ